MPLEPEEVFDFYKTHYNNHSMKAVLHFTKEFFHQIKLRSNLNTKHLDEISHGVLVSLALLRGSFLLPLFHKYLDTLIEAGFLREVRI